MELEGIRTENGLVEGDELLDDDNLEDNDLTEEETPEGDSIQLKDGTTIYMDLNVMEYESKNKVDKSIFTEENLSNVTINGEKQGRMVLHSFYDFGEGTRLTLRKHTETERLQEETTSIQNALVEVYEMLLSGE